MPEEPQRYVLSIAYKAGKDPRITKGADGGRDFFSAESLELAAWNYIAKGSPQVGIGHIDGTTGAATVVESYIYRGPDWDLGDGIVVTKGDWLGTGDRMDYLAPERKVILSGGAKAWQGKNQVSGETIIYYLDEGRSEVIPANVSTTSGKKSGRVNATIIPK